MKFIPTPLSGSFVVEMELFHDERGFFSYSFDRSQFEKQKLPGGIVQSNLSFNKRAGTLRGMHFQIAPRAQAKFVRCTAGGIYDVIVDLRRESPTYCQWFGVELTGENHRSLYIPTGFAHGFETLAANTEVLYEMFEEYAPELARGVRYDDGAFGIRWPMEVAVISERDRTYPDYQK